MFQVGVEHDVLDHLNLVVRVVNNLQIGRRREVKHLCDLVVAGVKFDQVLNVRQLDE